MLNYKEKKLFLLELNKILALDIKFSLEKEGFNVQVIDSVEEFKSIKIPSGSIILITLSMLLEDHIKEIINNEYSHLPVFLISGRITTEEFLRQNFPPNYYFLPKPFTSSELIPRLKMLKD